MLAAVVQCFCGHSADTDADMAEKLTDKLVRDAGAPDTGNAIYYDDKVRGFGIRVTAAGARAFILNYRVAGRERRITIGSFPDWTTATARDHASKLKRQVDDGFDPMAERHADRAAPTVDDLADRFDAEHIARKRPMTQREYRSILRLHIRPALGKLRVADLRHVDVERLHRKVAAVAPYQANRVVAVLSKMLALAVKWEIRADNPAKGIEREPEPKRERFLSSAEISRLASVLATHPERTSCNAIRLLLLTGARRGETLSATWQQFDLDAGVWTKPSAATKQGKLHRVPLSAAAVALLTGMRSEAEAGCPFVFLGTRTVDTAGKVTWAPLVEVKRAWLAVCIKSGLAVQIQRKDKAGRPMLDAAGQPLTAWQATARVHDLRHSFASILASSGLSLPIIGALLGHTQTATTARYAHLLDDPLRAATERVGALVSAGEQGVS